MNYTCIKIYSFFMFMFVWNRQSGLQIIKKQNSEQQARVNSLRQQFDKSWRRVKSSMLDLLTRYLTHFSDIIAYRGNCMSPSTSSNFFLSLSVDIVTSKIQLSGMLLNFWRGWRAGWQRYCSRVFHQHSDQYHQILNMGRNHSLWRAVWEREWTKAGKHKIYYLGCWQKGKRKNLKWLGAWGILTRFTQTIYLFILCFVEFSTLEA